MTYTESCFDTERSAFKKEKKKSTKHLLDEKDALANDESSIFTISAQAREEIVSEKLLLYWLYPC